MPFLPIFASGKAVRLQQKHSGNYIERHGYLIMEKNAKIYIAGHRGMVGSAIHRKLQKEGFTNIITRTSDTLDLRNQQQVTDFFAQEKPDYVFLAAAKVGGIIANNTYRAEFL